MGVMLPGGDPASGSAGYVAIETVSGHLGAAPATSPYSSSACCRRLSDPALRDTCPASAKADSQASPAPFASRSRTTAPTATSSNTNLRRVLPRITSAGRTAARVRQDPKHNRGPAGVRAARLGDFSHLLALGLRRIPDRRRPNSAGCGLALASASTQREASHPTFCELRRLLRTSGSSSAARAPLSFGDEHF